MTRLLIVDDEAPARTRLRKLLAPLIAEQRVEVIGEASDATEALARLQQESVDLLLLDVRMPGLTGFDMLERLPPDRRPEVIFVTAHDDYALRAFDAHALDYLLKPVNRARLVEAVSRVERMLERKSPPRLTDDRLGRLLDWLEQQESPSRPETEDAVEPLRQISVPLRDRLIVFPVEQLVVAEVVDGLTRLLVIDDPAASPRKTKEYVVGYTLDQLEARLDPHAFLRVHRSALVALTHVKEMVTWFSGRYKLRLTGGHEVISSRERSRILKQRLTL